MKTQKIIPILSFLFLAGCGQALHVDVTYLPSVRGKSRYSVAGVVMVPEFKVGISKPYAASAVSKACPKGVRYIEYKEAINKEVITGTWVQWEAILECR